MDSPMNKEMQPEDVDKKGVSKSEQRRRALHDAQTEPRTEARESGGKNKFFFPQLNRTVEADTLKEAEEIINKET